MFILFRSWLAGPPVRKTPQVVGYALGRDARRYKTFHQISLALVFLTFCVLFQPRANSQVKQVRRVLAFYELGHSSPAVALPDREMRDVLDDSRYQIELYSDYLETTLFDDLRPQQEFRN